MKDNISCLGVIAEDQSDVDVVQVLVGKILNRHCPVKKHVGKGCGKINRKSNAWAENLKKRGCSSLVLIHDLDENNFSDLEKKITEALLPTSFNNYLISIPVRELESWLLSDSQAVKTGLNLRTDVKIQGRPENFLDPKKYLGAIVYKASNKEKIYLNTTHNKKIAENISIPKILSGCPSFISFHEFICRHS